MGNAAIARKCVIPAIRKSRNGMPYALATRYPDKAAEVARANGIKKIYDSYDALLSDQDVDAVYIPLPNNLHLPWTCRALKKKKHVLCEKPLACSEAEARNMADTAAETGSLLMEAFMYRFHPRSSRIRQIIREGLIGPPRLIHAAFCFCVDTRVLEQAADFRFKPEEGGGALLDVGCYCVSVARWLFNDEPSQVQAQAVYHPGGVDMHVAGTLRFPRGRLATFQASFISALQQTFTVTGTDGAVELPHDAFIPWEHDASYRVRGKDEEQGKVYDMPGADEYRLMVEHFADAALTERSLVYTPEDSICNMHVLDALTRAARTGRAIAV